MSGGFKKVALGVALSTSNAIKAAGDALGSPEVRKTVGAVASGTAMVLATGCHGGGGAPEKVNHAPKITDGVFNNGGVPFNSTKSINLSTTLHASDEDGDVVSYRINRIISGEANGTATISGSSLTFVPATGVEGSQVIEIIAVDDRGAVSAPRTLTISEIDTKAPEVSDPIPDTTSPTNHDVTVLITSNETDDITSTSTGWTRVGASGNWTFSKTYTTNITNDLFIAQDRAGNTTTKSVSITNIIKQTPEVEDAVYSTTAPTNQDVVVTFKSLQDLVTPTGYTKTFDNASRKFLFTKAYSENTNETITFFDVAGNKAEKTVSITNLDRTAPGVITFDADTTNTSILTHVVVNENGKGYLWIPGYTPGNQPTVQDVIDHATQDSSVLTLTKDQVASYLRSGLFAATSYVTYLVTEDGLGNKSNITIKSFTTLEDPDSPSNVLAPNMTATTNAIHMSNNITDADGVRNVVFFLYSNASGTALVSQNSTGDFSSLASNTDFWGKTTAETYNKTSRTWTTQTSPLGQAHTLSVDSPENVAAPTLTATGTNTISAVNNITDADGVQNVVFYLYSNAAGTTLVASNTSGNFSGLTANTQYWVKTTAEVKNGTTGAWVLSTSTLSSVTTLSADAPESVAAPTLTATGTTSITVVNNIADADGVRNVIFLVYSDAAGTVQVASTATSPITGLTANTQYWVKTTAEVKNGTTGVWSSKASPLASVTTLNVDSPESVVAPTLNATGMTTLSVTNNITDTDGVQNVTYYLYSDAAGTALVASNTSGNFTGLTANTQYWAKTTAEVKNGTTGAWTLKTSGLNSTTTLNVDSPESVVAPTLNATGMTTLSVTNNITDTDGVQNVTYYLYSDAAGTALVASNTSGNFTGLTANTQYWAKTTAEVKNGTTGAWTLKTSGLNSTTTLNVDAPDSEGTPTFSATGTTTLSVTNNITDPDGIQNITYYVYSDAAGATLVSSNATGNFTGLTANTQYWAKTTAEVKNGTTGAWTLKTSPLASVTTLSNLPADLGVTFDSTSDSGQFNNDNLTNSDIRFNLVKGTNTTDIERNIDGTGWTSVGTGTTNTIIAGSLADGTHTIEYRAMNGVNPQSGTPTTFTITFDSVVGTETFTTMPSIQGQTYADVQLTGEKLWKITSANGGTVGTVTYTAGVNHFSYTAPNTATDTLTLYDIAGNTTTKVLTLTGIPAAPVASMTTASDSGSSNSDGYTNLSPVYIWSAVANATGYVLVVDGGPQIDLGNVLTTTLSGYADGPHTVAIYSKNAAGLSATAYTGSFTLDTLAQAVPAPASLSDTTNLKPTFTWTSVSGATSYLVSLDGGAEVSVGSASFTPSSNLSIGSHNIKVRSVDQAGNQSVQSSAATVNVIPTAPLSPTNLTINGGATGAYTNTVTIAVTDPNAGGVVTGWYISENSSTPAAGAAGWTASAPTTYTFTGGDGLTKTIYTWVKNGPSVQSTPATSTITLDTITPSNPQWISMAPPQANTDYNGWKMRVLNYGVSGLSTNLADWNITSLNGGTVTILSVNSDGTITVNYHSPSGVGGDTLQINGKSGTGKPFSTTIDTDIFG